jgi:hypothetical protein
MSTCQHANVLPQAEMALLLVTLAQVAETGPALLTSLLAATVHLLDDQAGTQLAKPLPSTEMHTETHPAVVVAADLSLLAEVEPDNGEMASTLLDPQTHVKSVSFSASRTTQASNKPVSTSRSTMTSQLKLPATTFQSQFSSSPTHLSMTISSRTSSLHTTRFLHQSKSTPFLLSWVVVT